MAVRFWYVLFYCLLWSGVRPAMYNASLLAGRIFSGLLLAIGLVVLWAVFQSWRRRAD